MSERRYNGLVTMRLPGLDGIRAISIALVILYHASTSAAGRPIMEFGAFGVNIFFVLSGFLITWILCSEETDHHSISLPAFYARRALRILPPATTYLLVLLILSANAIVSVSLSDVGSCLLFMRNVLPGSSQTRHFWSLSVEEQFYLIWPLVMVLLRHNRARLRFSVLLLAVSPIWHQLSFRLEGGANFVNHARFDQAYEPILLGCCLALMRNDPKLLAFLRNSWFESRWFPFVAIAVMPAFLAGSHLERLAYVTSALFINYAVDHNTPILNSQPVMWVGKISYSLYLWQQLFCWQFSSFWLGRFPQNVIASVLAAACSYYLIELPFSRLRRRIRHVQNPVWLVGLRASQEAARAE